MAWHEGYIGFGWFGGFVVRPGIDAKDAEVAGVPGPHPVVGVAAELAYATGWSAHQPHITKRFGDDKDV